MFTLAEQTLVVIERSLFAGTGRRLNSAKTDASVAFAFTAGLIILALIAFEQTSLWLEIKIYIGNLCFIRRRKFQINTCN